MVLMPFEINFTAYKSISQGLAILGAHAKIWHTNQKHLRQKACYMSLQKEEPARISLLFGYFLKSLEHLFWNLGNVGSVSF